MMRKLLILVVVGAFASAGAIAADRYTIDPTFTVPTFEIGHLGFTTQQGRFNHATGTVVLDRAAHKGSVELIIDTTSLDMSSAAWTRHLAEPDLFNSEKYPTMTFQASTLTFKGDKVVGADGMFTLRGITKPLRVTVNGFRCLAHPMTKKEVCGGDVTAVIKRSEFGMTKYIPEVSDEISIRVPVEAHKD
jgi:polyisoprenoid-binding protein YceI